MIVGYKPDHSDHDQALTTLLQTAKKCNIKLNYDNCQYNRMKVNSLVKHTQQVAAYQAKIKWQQLHLCHHQPTRSKYNPLLA